MQKLTGSGLDFNLQVYGFDKKLNELNGQGFRTEYLRGKLSIPCGCYEKSELIKTIRVRTFIDDTAYKLQHKLWMN